MAVFVLKTDPSVFRRSTSAPKLPSAETNWIRNPPSFSTLDGTVDPKYWKINGGQTDILEMTAGEKATVDANEAAALLAARRAEAINEMDETDEGVGIRTRALIENSNKRCNYIITRLEALIDAIQDDSQGTNAANIRNRVNDALSTTANPSAGLNVATRPKPDAVQDYRDEVNNGDFDT